MDVIEDIGPILGIVAFLGFAILALLVVLQAREVRRLREWAGRAPERTLEADEADGAVAEARGEEPKDEGPSRFDGWRERVAAAMGPRWEELDRRSPVDPRWFGGVLVAGLVALGIVTGGFGLTGDDEPVTSEQPGEQSAGGGSDGGGGSGGSRERGVRVAVLNATQLDDPVAPVPGVPGIADLVADEVVRPAGFRLGERANAPAGEAQSVIMFEPGAEEAATELSAAVEPDLGSTETVPITNAVASVSGDAELVLLVGRDDDSFGQAA